MPSRLGECLFVIAPLMLAAVLLWKWPKHRRFRLRTILLYLLVMSGLITGALHVVASIATARVIYAEVLIVLWFTIAWRLAWEIWSHLVGPLGQKWVRWRRAQRQRGMRTSLLPALIPFGRATLTALVFATAFLSMVLTHRCKLADGQDPLTIFLMPFDHVRIPTADGLTLDGWFIPEAGAERTIVICHGAGANKGNFIWFLGPLANRGYNVLFFDFRAHGGSDGRTTTYGIREQNDVLAAVQWLKLNRPNQSRRIVGLGSSQGSLALALAAAREPRIDAIVLDSPFVSPRELQRATSTRFPVVGPLLGDWFLGAMSLQTGTDFFDVSAEQAVRDMGPRPLMVVHGDDDFVMPKSHSQRLYDAASGPRELWFGPGPHSNIITDAPSEYADRLFTFLDRCLGPARTRKPPRKSAPGTSPAISQPANAST